MFATVYNICVVLGSVIYVQVGSAFVDKYYTSLQSILSGFMPGGAAHWVALAIVLIVVGIILMVLASLATLIIGWAERKIIARAQSRHGPVYVGKFGVLQNVADALKLITKENVMPENADRPLFSIMLPIVFAIYFIMLALIPLTSTFVGVGTSLGLDAVFMLLSLAPMLLFLAGWTSGNKFGSISAQRSIVMMVSYEIPLLLVLVAVVILSHTYSFASIVAAQSHIWYIAMMPIGFVIFFIMMLAESERPPFDLREADNELIAGWLTDVSAPYYALALLLDYTRLFVGALLITVLFLGGWSGPILPPFAWIIVKVSAITLVFILVRATTVRLRADRLLRIGWLYLLPASVINLFITFLLFAR